jgi:hypothetical protein
LKIFKKLLPFLIAIPLLTITIIGLLHDPKYVFGHVGLVLIIFVILALIFFGPFLLLLKYKAWKKHNKK